MKNLILITIVSLLASCGRCGMLSNEAAELCSAVESSATTDEGKAALKQIEEGAEAFVEVVYTKLEQMRGERWIHVGGGMVGDATMFAYSPTFARTTPGRFRMTICEDSPGWEFPKEMSMVDIHFSDENLPLDTVVDATFTRTGGLNEGELGAVSMQSPPVICRTLPRGTTNLKAKRVIEGGYEKIKFRYLGVLPNYPEVLTWDVIEHGGHMASNYNFEFRKIQSKAEFDAENPNHYDTQPAFLQ